MARWEPDGLPYMMATRVCGIPRAHSEPPGRKQTKYGDQKGDQHKQSDRHMQAIPGMRETQEAIQALCISAMVV